MIDTRHLLALAALAVALAACSRHDDVPPPENVRVEEPLAVPPPVEEPVAPSDNVAQEIKPPAPAVDEPSEAQVQQDAEASGMTSRVPGREDSAPVATNAAQ